MKNQSTQLEIITLKYVGVTNNIKLYEIKITKLLHLVFSTKDFLANGYFTKCSFFNLFFQKLFDNDYIQH